MKCIKRKSVLLFISVLLFSFILQACKGQERTTAQLEEAFVKTYSKTSTDLQITPDYKPQGYFMVMSDSLCYFLEQEVEESATGESDAGEVTEEEAEDGGANAEETKEPVFHYALYSQSLSGEGEPKLLTDIESAMILAFHLYSGEEELLCVLAYGEDKYILTEYDTFGAVKKQFELTDEAFVKDYMSDIRRCKDGSYLAYNANVMYTFDDTGRVSKAVECPGAYFQDGLVTGNDTAYIAYLEESGKSSVFAKVDVKSGTLKESCNIPINVSRICEGVDGKFYLLSSEALYDYDMSARKVTKKLELSVYNIRHNEVMSWSVGGEVITLLSWETGNGAAPVQLITLEPKTEEQLAQEQNSSKDAGKYDADGRRIITVYDPYGLLENSAALDSFNKYNEEYNVQLVGKGNYNYETILAAADSPDLLYLIQGNQVETYEQGGYLEDLKPFIERSENLSMEDLQGSVAEYFTYDGGLYGLSESAALGTLMCLESQVDGKNGWTVDEFLTWMEENPTVRGSLGMTRRSLLDVCLKGNMESYVDFARGQADFTGEAFKRMLSKIKPLQPDGAGYLYSIYTEYDASDTHLFNEYVNDVLHIAELETVYGEKLVNMGYPCDSGEPKVLLDCNMCLSILAKSECKEGAYAFLEHYLLYDSQAGNQETGYSARLLTVKSRMDKEWAAADKYTYIMAGSSPEGRENIEFEIKQETKDKVLAMFESAQRDTLENYLIRDIICEEAEAYFQGQKDLDAVCEIMQSRVNILLSERR